MIGHYCINTLTHPRGGGRHDITYLTGGVGGGGPSNRIGDMTYDTQPDTLLKFLKNSSSDFKARRGLSFTRPVLGAPID